MAVAALSSWQPTIVRRATELSTTYGPAGCPKTPLIAGAPADVVSAVRWPHPKVLQVLDPRPLLDEAAVLAARFGGTGLLTAEPMAAGLAHGRQLWFGAQANVGRLLERAAGELDIELNVLLPP
jgi:hypothetical protein